MNLRDLGKMLRRYWVSIVGCTLVGLALASSMMLDHKPTYVASTTLWVYVQPEGTSPDDLSNAAQYAVTEVGSMMSLANTAAVLQPVIERLQLTGTSPDALRPMIALDTEEGSGMEITVSSSEPELSARLAQEIANELVTNVATRSPKDEVGAATVVASIVTPATIPQEPADDDVDLTLLVGTLVGLAVGIVQAAIRAALDNKVRSEEDVARVTGREVFARIPFDRKLPSGRVGVIEDPHSPLAEGYRGLRTNLLYASAGGPAHAFVVTSAVADEGKSTTAIGIASALADAGESVLLIDADLRAPSVGEYLRLDPAVGLADVLGGEATLAEAVQRVGSGKLDTLPAGGLPSNPAELLGSDAMKRLLDDAVEAYDRVVLDAPAVLPVTDAPLLAALCRDAVLVVGSGTVTAPQLRDAVAALERVSSNILGIVLTKVRRSVGDGTALPRRTGARAGRANAAASTVSPARSSMPTRAITSGDDALAER